MQVALNMVTRTMAVDLKELNITVHSIHPGWVKTDMGGEAGQLTPEESAADIIRTMHKLTAEQSGLVLNHDGAQLQW